MWTTDRRSLVRNFLRVPIVAGIAKWTLFGSGTSVGAGEDEIGHDRKFLAVRTLRLVNTLQLWHFSSRGHYADLSELGESETAAKLVDSESAGKARIGRSLFSILHFDSKEIVPGWEFEYKLKDDRRGYSVVLKDNSREALGAFSTDQRGIIFEGEPVDVSDSVWQSADVLVFGKPIESGPHKPGKYASLLKAIAFGPISVHAICCGGCCPGCSCFGPGQGVKGCVNCGCLCCVWCCCN